MLDFLKLKKKPTSSDDTTPNLETSLFAKLTQGLSRTRQSFKEGLSRLFLGKKEIDAELLEELENLLITADLGVETTSQVIQQLTQAVERKELNNFEALCDALKEILRNLLLPCELPLQIPSHTQPYVILMVGVNGSGKTTTIGKLAKKFKTAGQKVLLAAGDTFRAAAVEQLQAWGDKNDVPVVAQQSGADSASVIFDAVQAAKSRGVQVLIADTAGRLHTQDNLMEELKKVVRVIKKIDPTAPHEVLLVLDAGIGQNALNQAKKFQEAVGVTGIVMTKLDGTAKGGIIFNIAHTLKLPIHFIGIGEGVEDLRPFNAHAFVETLFAPT